MPLQSRRDAMSDSKPTLRSSLIALALTAVLSATALAQDRPQPRLQTIELAAGMHLIHAEVAQTPQQQATGMMFRTAMGANEGMLFVNEQPGVRCFWMRNTLLPLAIAFIAEMQARSDDSHCSDQPVRFALEMPKGWFAKRGIAPGSKLRGSPFRP
jgi:uncharacterized membrane protein (UPF0127 family)